MNTVERAEQLARAHNLSLSKLAEISGIGYSTLKVARARGTQLSVDTIGCICKSLNMTMAEFFSAVDESERTQQVMGQLSLLTDNL